LLDRPPTNGGDVHMINGAYVRLEDIGKAYQTGAKNNNDGQEP